MPEQATVTKSVLTAQTAFKHKDFKDAAYHVAGALAQDPLNNDVLTLFDEIISEAPELETLIPLKDNNFFGELIARAYIDSKQGKYRSAISLILRVLNQYPEIGLEKWLPQWIADARFQNIQIDLEELIGFFSNRLASTKGRIKIRPTEREYYIRLVPTAFALIKYFPENLDVLSIASNLFRQANQLDDAIHTAQEAIKKQLDPDAAVALGLAYRADGQYNRAISAFEQAYKIEKDSAFFIEMALTRWDAGGLKAALKYLNKALKRDETLMVNTEFNCMLRYLKTNKEIVNVIGSNAKPDDIKLVTTPLVGYLFNCKDYTVLSYEQSRELSKHRNLTINAPHIEPASALLALALASTGRLDLSLLDYKYTDSVTPDPYQSIGNPSIKAWNYDTDHDTPVQAVTKPDDEIYRLVLKLATQTYYLPHWWQQAQQIMKNKPLDTKKFIGAMVFPKPTPENFKTAMWISHQQMAATLLIAASEKKWHGSRRRKILLDLLHGPIDWITNSVLIALTEIALDCPSSTEEIAFEFEQLAERIPTSGHWSAAVYLPLSYNRLPARSDTLVKKLNCLISNYTQSAKINTELVTQ